MQALVALPNGSFVPVRLNAPAGAHGLQPLRSRRTWLQWRPIMSLHLDFLLRATVTAAKHRWVASPHPGIERLMLGHLGAEQAWATSPVRYAPTSILPAHGHLIGLAK